jgi:hypothetical protein
MDRISRGELNRTTLHRQSLLERSTMSAEEALRQLVGLQAQNPNDPYWALWSRIEGFDPELLSGMISRKEAVRGQLLRATIHLVTTGDFLTLRPLLQPVMNRTLGSTGFARDTRDVDREALLVLARSLLAQRPMSRAELAPILAEAWPSAPGASLAQVVTYCLPVVQVPPRGLWRRSGTARWTTVEDWVESGLEPGAGVDGTVLRYLAAFGPASVSDIRVWCGLPGLREAVERLRPDLRTYRAETGTELFDLPDLPIVSEAVPAPPRFLPEYDNVLLGHADRSRFFAEGVTPAGWAGNLLLDGTFGGNWKIVENRQASRLEVRLLTRATRRQLRDIGAEGERLVDFWAPGSKTPEIEIGQG